MTDELKIDLFNEVMTRQYAYIQKDDTPQYWGETYDQSGDDYEHDECATFDEAVEQMENDTRDHYVAFTEHYQEMLKRFKRFKELLATVKELKPPPEKQHHK